MNKREFLKDAIVFFPAAGVLSALSCQAAGKDLSAPAASGYDPTDHWYGMGIDVDKCIGCNRCVEACKAENDVPDEPYFFRTWVERYTIHADGETTVECISTKPAPVDQVAPEDPSVVRTFFVPSCAPVRPPALRAGVPGGRDVPDEGWRRAGRREALHRLPLLHPGLPVWGALPEPAHAHGRQVHVLLSPRHEGPAARLRRVCPTEARIFGDMKARADRLVRFERANPISVLKPDLNTEPKVRYAKLDGEVR